jgi:hypothetical protein
MMFVELYDTSLQKHCTNLDNVVDFRYKRVGKRTLVEVVLSTHENALYGSSLIIISPEEYELVKGILAATSPWSYSSVRSTRERLTEEALVAAHKYSSNNSRVISHSQVCGCFYCKKTLSSGDIKESVNDDKTDEITVLCPYCRIDAIIGDASGFEITEEFLQKMYERWFERTKTPEQLVEI